MDNASAGEAGAATGVQIKETVLVKASEKDSGPAVMSNALEHDDEFKDFELSDGSGGGAGGLVAPPFYPKSLVRHCEENNALSPCIEAMVTNVDGTGYTFERRDDKDVTDDPKVKTLTEFFDQVWPGKSFLTVRKELRRDQEQTGNAYLEVIRNPSGEIIFLRRLEAKYVRLVKYDAAVPVTKTMMRGGVRKTVRLTMRERRYVQRIGKSFVHFKEFGASRDVNKNTGAWSEPGQKLPAAERGSEIIHFRKLPAKDSDYGIPAWISQLPSVLGSREAEMLNLEFFNSGGVPPIMIFLQGGALAPETKEALQAKLNGPAKKANRVTVFEVDATGGNLDTAGSARVTVERFGAERQNDSMFEKYDDKCEARIRRAWRLPPIFVGMAQDYAFATAVASYLVGEMQVFHPEREEFDEIISNTLLPELGFGEYKLRSLPLSIQDIERQLQAIGIAQKTNRVNPEEIIEALNELTGLSLNPTDVPVGADGEPLPTMEEQMKLSGGSNSSQGASQRLLSKSDGAVSVAVDLMLALRDRDTTGVLKALQLANGLDQTDKHGFRETLADLQFMNAGVDYEGLSELAGCTVAVMQEHMDREAA